MEDLSQIGAELPPLPPDPPTNDAPDPGPTNEEREAHLEKVLPELRIMTDKLLNRYQETGIKWHFVPFAARASVDMMDEVYSVDDDGELAHCVYEKFCDLVTFLVESQRALERGDTHTQLLAATVYADSAEYAAMKLEEMISTTEAAVADVIALRNAMDEQDLLPQQEVMLDVKLVCFEDWLDSLKEAEADWIVLKS